MAFINKKKTIKNDSINRQQRQKIYQDKRWKSTRLSYLQKNPLCELCLFKGIIKSGEDIHHIISPFKYNGATRESLAFTTDNLLTLCKDCHSKLHSNHKEDSLYNIYYERVGKRILS